MLSVRGGKRCFQIFDVDLCCVWVLHSDGSVAGGSFAAGTAGVAKNTLGEVGKLNEVLIDESVSGTAEPGKPVLDVGCVARLRHLPVIDEINSKLDLFANDLRHRGLYARGKRPSVH